MLAVLKQFAPKLMKSHFMSKTFDLENFGLGMANITSINRPSSIILLPENSGEALNVSLKMQKFNFTYSLANRKFLDPNGEIVTDDNVISFDGNKSIAILFEDHSDPNDIKLLHNVSCF